MQNLISSAFDTVTTVEQGVELLDIFMHLSLREVSSKHSFFCILFLFLCVLRHRQFYECWAKKKDIKF